MYVRKKFFHQRKKIIYQTKTPIPPPPPPPLHPQKSNDRFVVSNPYYMAENFFPTARFLLVTSRSHDMYDNETFTSQNLL